METLIFKNKNIRIIKEKDEYWFCASDICKILEIKNVSAGTNNICDNWKKIYKINTNGGFQKLIIINKYGMRQLIYRCRKLNNIDIIQYLSKYLGSDIKIMPFVETKYIGFLFKCLNVFNPIQQFPIKSYKIDLYIPIYKIAVECDENNHKYSDTNKELDRQSFIEKTLNCQFIRFNP
jgi:hypothetical protein